ncbi:MAG: tetratricopeptide repeat protein, partial [Bacteroidales bacterium]|nr:tetratricopeptide repeat protein [Bacteroidales bacterium]
LKREFLDIFEINLNFNDSILFKTILQDKTVLRNIAEFYFEKEYFIEALGIFNMLSEETQDFEVLEKAGYCHQQIGNYEKALNAYLKAELYDTNKLWLSKKIAYCYQMSGKYKDAIRYLEQAEKINPDDLYIQAYLGHSYMDLGEYEKALKYYYKVEYLEPDNHKIQRPIAWCSFLMGKFEPAKKYMEKVIKKENNKNDYLNLGHIEWCMGNKQTAIENYKKAVKKSEYDFEWFDNEYKNDSKYLIKHGINAIDIPLMLDFIKTTSGK